MDIRRISADFAVSPQIAPEDLPELALAGFRTVICNRPDDEVPLELQSATLRIATEAAGLTFVENPVTHLTLTIEAVRLQRRAIGESDGPVLAYCASGTRSAILWSLTQAGVLGIDAVLEATLRAGHDLAHLRPLFEAALRRG